jgi:Fe-S-cluster containining protein
MTEAVRIANGLAVPVDDVVERVPGADGHHPWFTIPIPLEDGLETLALRRTSHGSCRFLLGVGSRGRCAIHPMRAGVCRLFPYEVDYGGRRYSVGDQSLCPKAWLVDKDSPRRVQRDLEAWLTDLAAEEDLVARWSRRSRGARSWSAWVAFARRHGT